MICKSEGEFAALVKGGAAGGLYLLFGGEGYLVDLWRKKLTARFGGDSFNFQRLDGRRLDCDELYDATEALPLMAVEKCVVVEDLELSKLPPAQQEKLWAVVGDLAPGCTLIITGKTPVFDPKSAAGKKLVKLAGEHGTAVELGSRSPGDMAAFLKALAKREGCVLSTDLARHILQICETDMQSLSAEVAKICALAGGGEIMREHVDAVAVPRTEARVFDLSKAILAGNAQRAAELLSDLFYLRESPISILSVLVSAYVDLYRARVARDSGASQGEVAERFGYRGREFRVRNAWNGRLSREALRRSLEALQQCDQRMKSTGVDGKILLEEAVVRLMALRGA